MRLCGEGWPTPSRTGGDRFEHCAWKRTFESESESEHNHEREREQKQERDHQ
ncbi:hypothetical protein [Halomontanus rarus]|uniref:hypothetical protein n=1 Tax=Halomontanus rarus TaxID=3034020 RepID=UPI001A982283